MNTEKLNTWLTLVANLGVVLGLVFLGIEIQQSRISTEASNYQARSTEIQEANQNFALSDHLPEIYDKLDREGLESLDSIQIRRIRAWEAAKIGRMASQIQQSNLGFLDEDLRNEILSVAASNLPLWESLGLNVGTGFREAIDNRVLN